MPALARAAESLRNAGFAEATEGPLHALLQRGRLARANELPAALVDALLDAGLIEAVDDGLRPLMRVDAWDGLLIAHDPDRSHEIGPETVLGVNNTTRTLATLTPRAPVLRALDLATGPGGLALRMAGHASTVVATDLSADALRYAAINASLNSIALDLRSGDLLAPVAGEEPFDLITANLPFVVSPDTSFTFRDGGHDRDGVSREAIVGAAAHLAEGGTAVLLCNWTVQDESDPWATPTSWLEPLGIASIVLHHSTASPEKYAARWNQFLRSTDAAAYDAALDRWTTAYREWGIAGIASGAIVLHRGASVPSFVSRQVMSRVPAGDGGSQLMRILRNETWLTTDGTDDAALLSSRLCVVGPNRLEQSMRFDGTWTADAAAMVLDDTAGMEGRVDPLSSHAVFRLDGRDSLQSVIDEIADDTGLDADDLRASTLQTARQLLRSGCLERSA